MGMSSYVSPGKPSLNPETQRPPPAGSPKNHSPRRGPTILRGTFGARVRATSLPRKIPRQIMPLAAMRPARMANSGRAAAYFMSPARHSPGRRLPSLHAPKEFSSCLRTLRTRTTLIRSNSGPPKSTGARFHRARTLFGDKKKIRRRERAAGHSRCPLRGRRARAGMKAS